MLLWTTSPVNVAENGPIVATMVTTISVSDIFSIRLQPAMQACSTAGSLIASQSCCRRAGMRYPPQNSMVITYPSWCWKTRQTHQLHAAETLVGLIKLKNQRILGAVIIGLNLHFFRQAHIRRYRAPNKIR